MSLVLNANIIGNNGNTPKCSVSGRMNLAVGFNPRKINKHDLAASAAISPCRYAIQSRHRTSRGTDAFVMFLIGFGKEAYNKLREAPGHSASEQAVVFGIDDLVTFADSVF